MDRRIVLLGAARIAALAALGAAMPQVAARAGGAAYPFSLGVASGAPLPTSVVIWTRILFDPLNAAAMPALAFALRWEVAEDEAFARIVARGTASAAPQLAHSVHVDVTGLQPARWYWYRFFSGDAASPVGRTRTAPAPDALPERLKLVAASCQHWEFGSYAAHRHIAAAAPDLVAFLGDYIYEWGPYRLTHPLTSQYANECFTLADYRARYAQYKSDPDLQAAHLAAPWIVTWDDHEVANDYANDSDERLDAHFLQRRAGAYQAFYEHMPVRLADTRAFGAMRVYQCFDWGRLARLHLLDTRQYRAHEACLPPGRGGSAAVTRSECRALQDPARSMLGRAQEAWLADNLASSRARWNIIAQQTLMAQASQLPITTPGGGRFWTDGWDGYPAARRRLLDQIARSKTANALVLSGDVHTFYAADLRADFDRPVSSSNRVVASEFCGTSITSSSRPQERTARYLADNPHLQFGRSDKRGFMLLDVAPAAATVSFMALADVHDARSAIAPLATFRVEAGRPGLHRL